MAEICIFARAAVSDRADKYLKVLAVTFAPARPHKLRDGGAPAPV